MPGLDPVKVEGVRSRPGDPYEVAHVHDSQDRLWSVKAPTTQAAGAMLEDVTTLSHLLGRRLEVAIPMVRGQIAVPEGRAVVYLRVPGRPLDFAGLPPGPLAGEVGRTLAHIHNVEHLLYEEAGLVSYDAEAHRRRQLSELDRAAATGHVPTNLLTRWENLLEDVSLWRFAPCPVHGTFTGENVLASFDDDEDAGSGRVRGVLAWEEAHIGDPADDFAELITTASPEATDSVLEAYAQSRVERPDPNLVARARLAGEMAPLRTLLRALAAGQLGLVEQCAERLRLLDEQTEADDRRHAEEDLERQERARRERAEAFAAAEAAAGRARPENLPDDVAWEATAPHLPFAQPGDASSQPPTEAPTEPPTEAATDVSTEPPTTDPATDHDPDHDLDHDADHDADPAYDPDATAAHQVRFEDEPETGLDSALDVAPGASRARDGSDAAFGDGSGVDSPDIDSPDSDRSDGSGDAPVDDEGPDVPHTDEVPILARYDGSPFEIEEAEPLPADDTAPDETEHDDTAPDSTESNGDAFGGTEPDGEPDGDGASPRH